MNTAREPKQNDDAADEGADPRRGMRLINGRGGPARTFRIAIANDIFTSKASVATDGRSARNPVGSTGDTSISETDQTTAVRSRSDGVKALGLAFTVAAAGMLLRYLLSDRGK